MKRIDCVCVEIGLIPVDAVFSPVRRVAYKVENTRVGQVTDYDKYADVACPEDCETACTA